eukprot:TRINITY_DN4071_c0_g2_i1.p1 TRINITY_DN4071_c0_g2~~TRINITY_DN4071_c0_g2_i1.p1  ORF type:complete len:452 (+),score=52.57 TRINITY_DN4071_c0_g2_i1:88-1356(+)
MSIDYQFDDLNSDQFGTPIPEVELPQIDLLDEIDDLEISSIDFLVDDNSNQNGTQKLVSDESESPVPEQELISIDVLDLIDLTDLDLPYIRAPNLEQELPDDTLNDKYEKIAYGNFDVQPYTEMIDEQIQDMDELKSPIVESLQIETQDEQIFGQIYETGYIDKPFLSPNTSPIDQVDIVDNYLSPKMLPIQPQPDVEVGSNQTSEQGKTINYPVKQVVKQFADVKYPVKQVEQQKQDGDIPKNEEYQQSPIVNGTHERYYWSYVAAQTVETESICNKSRAGCDCLPIWRYDADGDGIEAVFRGCIQTKDARNRAWCPVDRSTCRVPPVSEGHVKSSRTSIPWDVCPKACTRTRRGTCTSTINSCECRLRWFYDGLQQQGCTRPDGNSAFSWCIVRENCQSSVGFISPPSMNREWDVCHQDC